jgi:hypothetical protein
MKSILCTLAIVPLLAAAAVAQEPTADPKEGRLYLEGDLGFGVASMAGPADNAEGFDSIPLFGFGLAAQYGITEQFSAFTKLGVGVGLSDDPGTLSFGMTVDAAYKFQEKRGDAPALSAYAGLGFIHLDIDPDSSLGIDDDSEANFLFEFGFQAEIGSEETWSLQPYIQIQLVAGDRPFDGYNSVLQVGAGAKLFYKLADNLYLVPAIGFVGGNFQDQVMFTIGIQLRL